MANRYTDITPSVYSPLTFEEIAAVPAMKRKAHDELAKQLAESAVKVDPLKVHETEALRIKGEIEGGVATLSDQLAAQGITPEAQQQFYKLNKQYRDELAPTGRLGKINLAKPAYEAAKKAFMDAPENKEMPLEVKKKRWEEHSTKYTGFEGEGEDQTKLDIVNIGDLGAPGYQDLQKDLTWGHGLLGETTRTHLTNIGAHFKPGPFGGLIMVSADGKEIKTDNDKQLDTFKKFMEAKWIDPKGEGAQYAEFAYMDQKNLIDKLNAGMDMMIESKSVKDLNYNYQNISAPAGTGDEGGEVDILDIEHDITREDLTKKSFGQNQLRLGELQRMRDGLKAGEKLEPKLEAEYTALNKFVSQNNAKIATDPEYIKADKADKKIRAGFMSKAPTQYKDIYENILNGGIKLYNPDGSYAAGAGPFMSEMTDKRGVNSKDLQKILQDAKQLNANEFVQKKFQISNEYNKKNNLTSDFYQLAPRTEKGEQNYKRFNNQLEAVLATGTTNTLQNMGLITSVQVAGQDKYDLADEDRNGIQDMIKNQIEPGSLSIAGFSENNVTGMPSVKLSFTTKKDAPGYDLEGTSYDDPGTKVIGADGERITFDLDLHNLSNIPDKDNNLKTRHAVGDLAKFLYENGGAKGKAISIQIMRNLEKSKNKK